MPTLKIRIKGQEVEVILTMDEFMQLLSSDHSEKQFAIPNQSKIEDERSVKYVVDPATMQTAWQKPYKKKMMEKQIFESLKSDAEVKEYILNKPNYTHTLFDMQKHFFKKEFPSRGATKPMYHKTFHQIQRVRQQIEKEKGGKFTTEVGPHRISQYIFQRKQTVIPDEMLTQ
jgi:hypothetical protein